MRKGLYQIKIQKQGKYFLLVFFCLFGIWHVSTTLHIVSKWDKTLLGSQDNAVGIAPGYGLDDGGVRV
jgi:hypothetical protein